MPEWKDALIETGVDKLLDFIRKEGEVTIQEAADSLGVEPDTVNRWASSLEEAGMAEVKYTARKGRVVRPAVDEAAQQEKIEDVKQQVSDRIKELQQIEQEEGRLDRYQAVLERLEDELAEDETLVRRLKKLVRNDDAAADIDAYLADLDQAEEDVETLQSHLEAIKTDLDVLSTLEPDAAPKRGFRARIAAALPFVGRSHDRADGSGETYKCEQCERTFASEHGLKTHVGMSHKDEPDYRTREETDETDTDEQEVSSDDR